MPRHCNLVYLLILKSILSGFVYILRWHSAEDVFLAQDLMEGTIRLWCQSQLKHSFVCTAI